MKNFVHETAVPSQNLPLKKKYDVVFIGGGMSGLCGAIASARQGANTALIQDRSVFGGNASSETRMHISGASCHWGKQHAAETGILMELQLENVYLNEGHNFSIWDGVLWNAAKDTEYLDIYMNTVCDRIISDGESIQEVQAYQMNTEKRFSFDAKIFVDATGNGTVGYFAGAEYVIGRESAACYQEEDAPPVSDGETMGNTIYFVAEDRGHPVKFVRPSWAYSLTEDDFAYRYHGDVVVYHNADDVVVLGPDVDYRDHMDELVEKYDVKSGYWWIELGGDWDDIIAQAEDIRYELYRTVYGVWDHIKNSGDHGAENYELIWVGNVAGTRESRRLLGNAVLTEQDILENRIFSDAVAYGGWPMDEHVAGGFQAKGTIPSRVRSFPGLYTIPYGSYCSRTIKNLMMVGRNISASKLAMGSTRVMGTCAVGGEAVGTAAAMACRKGLMPWEFGMSCMDELQQELLKKDCYIPGYKNQDSDDLARNAVISATSEQVGYEAKNVVNGVARSVIGSMNAETNMWKSDGMTENGEVLCLELQEPVLISQVRLTLDPDLSEERCISVSKAFIEKEPMGVVPELLKDYEVIILSRGKEVARQKVEGNHQRLNILDFTPITADMVKIHVHATNGASDAHIFEVRVY